MAELYVLMRAEIEVTELAIDDFLGCDHIALRTGGDYSSDPVERQSREKSKQQFCYQKFRPDFMRKHLPNDRFFTEDSKKERALKVIEGLPVYSLADRGGKSVIMNKP